MKCLILGAGGQLGQEWMHQLRQLENSPFDVFRGFGSQELDITDSAAVSSMLDREQPEVVVNCAAYTRVDQAEEEKERARQVNAEAVKSLANRCASRGIKLVHYSTDYVFPGNAEDRKRFPAGYPEDHPTDPVNWYGATKLEGEEAIRRSDVDHLILRVSWLCGQFGSNFIKTMLRLVEEHKELDVVNDQWGSPTFTENVVRNSLQLLRQEQNGIFNITSDGLITWYDFAREIFAISGKEIPLNAVSSDAFETKAYRPKFSKLNIRKLSDVEGSSIIHWEEGLKNLLKQ